MFRVYHRRRKKNKAYNPFKAIIYYNIFEKDNFTEVGKKVAKVEKENV